jgi:prepilin-type N-terminal cleavage/methylation domain-containing protein
MQKMHKSKRNSYGFTLVEMIVVLVIAGILLAILVPGMLQWITKAKNEAAFQECRQSVVAVHTYAIEKYAADKEVVLTDDKAEILKLAKAPEGADITLLLMDNTAVQVSVMMYKTASGVSVKYQDGSYTVDSANLGDVPVRDAVLKNMDKTLKDHAGTGDQLDSGAVAVSDICNSAYLAKDLEKNGLILSQLNAKSWHYSGNSHLFYWTSQDITLYKNGVRVPAICYNVAKKTYTVQIMTISDGNTATGNGKKYRILSSPAQYKPDSGDTSDTSYAGALKLLAQAQKEYPAPTDNP